MEYATFLSFMSTMKLFALLYFTRFFDRSAMSLHTIMKDNGICRICDGMGFELTENGKTLNINKVTIAGKADYPSDMSVDASMMFGSNIYNLLKILIGKEGNLILNLEDEIISGTTAVHAGEYISERVRQLLNIN